MRGSAARPGWPIRGAALEHPAEIARRIAQARAALEMNAGRCWLCACELQACSVRPHDCPCPRTRAVRGLAGRLLKPCRRQRASHGCRDVHRPQDHGRRGWAAGASPASMDRLRLRSLRGGGDQARVAMAGRCFPSLSKLRDRPSRPWENHHQSRPLALFLGTTRPTESGSGRAHRDGSAGPSGSPAAPAAPKAGSMPPAGIVFCQPFHLPPADGSSRSTATAARDPAGRPARGSLRARSSGWATSCWCRLVEDGASWLAVELPGANPCLENGRNDRQGLV